MTDLLIVARSDRGWFMPLIHRGLERLGTRGQIRLVAWAVTVAIVCDAGAWLVIIADRQMGVRPRDGVELVLLAATGLATVHLMRSKAWARSWILGWSGGTLAVASPIALVTLLVGWLGLMTTGRVVQVFGLWFFMLSRVALAATPLVILMKREVRKAFDPWKAREWLIVAGGALAGLWWAFA